MNEIIENLLENGLVKTNDNEYGYALDLKTVNEINELGYSLSFTKSGIRYNKM